MRCGVVGAVAGGGLAAGGQAAEGGAAGCLEGAGVADGGADCALEGCGFVGADLLGDGVLVIAVGLLLGGR